LSPHKPERRKQRIPLEIFDEEIDLLLQLKHTLENKAGKGLKTNQIIRDAIRAYAHNIIDATE